MIPILAFDIETVPDTAGIRLLNGLPDSLTDAEVAEYAFRERRAKTGGDFMPHHLHRVAAISCCLRWGDKIHVGTLGSPEDSEAEMVAEFFRLLEKYTPQLVSWNGGGFDLPVLHYRALVHGIAAPRYWDMGEGDFADSQSFKWNNYISRYHQRHCDLMDLLALYQPRAAVPLDDIAKLCGFPGKMGMDGSKVWQAVQEGQIQAVRDYCETDAANTYLVYQRFRLMSGAADADQYRFETEKLRSYLQTLAPEKPHWAEFLAGWQAA